MNTIKDVNWVSEWGHERIKNMIENRPDWCVSRQRFWGVPIPLFIHKDTNELHEQTELILEKAAKIIEKGNIEAWFEYDKKELLGKDRDNYRLVTDTLDVWFDSGISHISVMQQRGLGDIADLYLEGSDQHRGWFQSSLITALATTSKPPYKTVLTHGFVVDADGQKMSKSQGNVIAPQSIIKDKGSDILRLWVANTDYTKEMNISPEIIKRTTESYRRIRNTIKFLLSNVSDFDEMKEEVKFSDMMLIDKWIIQSALDLQESIKDNYNNYKFHQIAQDIQNFCTTELGGYYLDIVKDRLYTTHKAGLARKSCQSVCLKLLKMINIWIAPILSFTAEEMYGHMKSSKLKSIFLEEWIQYDVGLNKNEKEIGEILFSLKQPVSKKLEEARNDGIIGSSLDATIKLGVNEEIYQKLLATSKELKYIFISSECH